MRSPYRVVWTEGLLMAPQHLQQQDAYHEKLLLQVVRAANPLAWGVALLEFDPAALKAGQVKLQAFAGVLPDGLSVACDAEAAELPPARPIDGHFGPTQRTLDVFLALPREREGNANYAGIASNDPGSAATRFRVTSRAVLDLASSQAPATVGFGHPNLGIRFGDEPMDDFEALKIAEVVRDASGAFALNEAFVPSSLRIGASAALVSRFRKVLAALVAKQRDLVTGLRQPEAGAVEFGPSDVARGLQLLGLNQVIPLVQHLVDTPDTPPLQAYLALVQAAGALCTFIADGDPAALPKFQFANLRATFDELGERIESMLGGVARQAYLTVPLEARKDGMFLGTLEDEKLAGCKQFILAVRCSMPEEQVADILPRLCRVASWSEIQDLFQAAAPGLPVHVTHRPPSEIPLRPGVVYFQLATSDGYWRGISAERNIAIFLPPPFEPLKTKLELLAVPAAGGTRSSGSHGSGRPVMRRGE